MAPLQTAVHLHCCDATYIPLSPVWLKSQAQEEPSHTYKAAIETLACRRLQCSLLLCWALSCDDIDDAGKEGEEAGTIKVAFE